MFGKTRVNFINTDVKIYDIQRIEINTQEEFVLELQGFQRRVKWFSDNDPALDIRVSKDSFKANIKAQEPGESKVILFSHGFKKILCIQVREQRANSLEIQAEEPVLK